MFGRLGHPGYCCHESRDLLDGRWVHPKTDKTVGFLSAMVRVIHFLSEFKHPTKMGSLFNIHLLDHFYFPWLVLKGD